MGLDASIYTSATHRRRCGAIVYVTAKPSRASSSCSTDAAPDSGMLLIALFSTGANFVAEFLNLPLHCIEALIDRAVESLLVAGLRLPRFHFGRFAFRLLHVGLLAFAGCVV